MPSGQQEPTAAQASIVDAVTRAGQLWISDAVVNGSSVLRIMVISYLTEARHVKALEDALENAAKALTAPLETGQKNPAMY
jgi:ribosomal silencing factor RsfS